MPNLKRGCRHLVVLNNHLGKLASSCTSIPVDLLVELFAYAIITHANLHKRVQIYTEIKRKDTDKYRDR